MTKMKKLSLAFAAMALSGSLAGPVNALGSTEVAQIRALVEAGDEAALRSYLLQNLSALDDSPLSMMLREYVQAPPERTFFTSLGFQSAMPDELQDILARSKSDSSLY